MYTVLVRHTHVHAQFCTTTRFQVIRSRYEFHVFKNWIEEESSKPSSKSCVLVPYDWRNGIVNIIGWAFTKDFWSKIWRTQMLNARQHIRNFLIKNTKLYACRILRGGRSDQRLLSSFIFNALDFFPLWMAHLHWCHYHKCIFLHTHTVCASEKKNWMEYNQKWHLRQ